ncbi:hypothetical protein [uncultured Shimia sp.]|uniref:hypothetical protein n=1 Tax=uncultured Shimia sp. TaxID=573152 RepID=UPI002630CB63|nr:hypothetical protein [uncultured Shimia sp.]
MSDPVTNVEIEDVLTSIRRLVSENGRVPVAAAQSEAEQQDEKAGDTEEAASERLVLTPALRVSETNEHVDDDTEAEAQIDDGPSYEAEDAVHTEIAEEEEVEAVDWGAADSDAHEDEAGETIDDVTPDESFDPDEGIALSDAQAMDSRLVQWESMSAAEQSGPYEPDEPGDSDYAGTEIGGLTWVGVGAEPVEPAQENAEVSDTTPTVDDADDRMEMPTFLRASTFTPASSTEPDEVVAADLEPAEAAEEYAITNADAEDVSDTLEAEFVDVSDLPPAGAESEAEHVETVETQFAAFSDRVAAEAVSYAEEEIEGTVAPELESLEVDETLMLDEAMLRDLVSDIVRQELQGALGERITRNVRKLVRREIHRALVAHELE